MKFLKQFESEEKTYQITYVDFRGGGDGVEALYIDGKLYNFDDEYFWVWLDGFSDALEYFNIQYKLIRILVEDEELITSVSEDGETPPPLEEIIIKEEGRKFNL